jgi:hypothetical protein
MIHTRLIITHKLINLNNKYIFNYYCFSGVFASRSEKAERERGSVWVEG